MDYTTIKKIAKSKGLSIKHLAEKSGITEQGFHAMVKNNSMTISTLERLCETLQISLVSLFSDGEHIKESSLYKDKYLSCLEEKEKMYQQIIELNAKSELAVAVVRGKSKQELK